MAQSRVESVPTPDGAFDLPVWLPPSDSGPGLLLIQEIYGVSDYIRAVAEDLAGLGYVVGAPDLFWRLTPGYQAVHDDAGLKASLEMGSRFDFEQGVADAGAALDHLAALPEVTGGTGVIGFCLGGSIAYLLAARPGAAAPTAAVSFYGSAVPGSLDVLERISVPLQFHFGGSDPFITRDQVAWSSRPRLAARTWRCTSRRTPGTPSTTARPRCSTGPSPPPGPGSAPRSSCAATCPCAGRPRRRLSGWPGASTSSAPRPAPPARATPRSGPAPARK
jgi:carboxymethylenebutenolidase